MGQIWVKRTMGLNDPSEIRLRLFFPSPQRIQPSDETKMLGFIIIYQVSHSLLAFSSLTCFSSFFFSVKPIKLNRIYQTTDKDKWTTGNRGKVWDKEIGLFRLSEPWFSSDSKGSVPPTESRKPLPVAVWFILEGQQAKNCPALTLTDSPEPRRSQLEVVWPQALRTY